MPLVGEELAGYRLEEVIGRGGMGTVFRAEHVALGRKAAVKIMNASLAADDRFRERFKREARLAASLDHPNIVPVYDAGESGVHLFIAMRYVEGTDVDALIESKGRLDKRATASIIAQIAAALDAAHRRGLVHRDVKPANVLLRSDPDDPDAPPHAYLTDFGVTRKIESTANLTATGAFVGSVQYAAPEQIAGGTTTPATDIYALGCLAYECLTGGPPFQREHDVATLWAHLNDPVDPVSDTIEGLSTEIDVALGRALAKEPTARWPTCASFASALQAGLGPERDTLVEEPQQGDGPGTATIVETPVPTPPTDPTIPPQSEDTVADRRRRESESAEQKRRERREEEQAECDRLEAAERAEDDRIERERVAAEARAAERAHAAAAAAEKADREARRREQAEAKREADAAAKAERETRRREQAEAKRAAAAAAKAEKQGAPARQRSGRPAPALLAGGAVVLLVAAIVAGRAVGGEETPKPPPGAVVAQSPALSLTLPPLATRRAATSLPELDGVAIEAPVVAASVGRSVVRAGALRSPRGGLDPLPASISRDGGARTLVKLPAGEAVRYDQPRDSGALRVFALSTAVGEWTVLACEQATAATCDAAAAGLRLRSAEALPLSPDEEFADSLAEARASLSKVRKREAPRVKEGSRTRRQSAASSLATAHRAAAAKLGDLEPPALAEEAVADEAKALTRLAETFTTLSSAARRNDRGDFNDARAQVTTREASLARAQKALLALGYAR